MLTKNTTCAPAYDYKGHHFVFRDEFNEEYSRDIEPMKGGYKDAYYLQMAAFCRRFKGMKRPAVDTEYHTVTSSDPSFWDNVPMTYVEPTGDVAPRDERAYDAVGRYKNYTGRNEFSVLKVANDFENVYFLAECSENIVLGEENGLVKLFLKTESDFPAWEGYNFAVKCTCAENGRATVEKCVSDGEFKWEKIAAAEMNIDGKRLYIKLPKSLIGIGQGAFRLEFKWSDNMQENDVIDFYENGDAAPRGRMNYIFILNQ
jgi:hypothetical protein